MKATASRGIDWLMMLALMPSMLAVGGSVMTMDNATDKLLNDFVGEFAQAELQGDTDFLGRTLTGDFLAIGPRGFKLTREQWIERHASGNLKHTSFAWDDLHVRCYGEAAIVTGRQAQQGTYKGHDIAGELRGTLVAVLIDDRWQIAGLHLSPLCEAKPAAGA